MSKRNNKQHYQTLKVLMVIPASQSNPIDMIFARRQIDAIEKAGVQVLRFFLESRTSFTKLWHSLREIRKAQLHFKPNLVHAHYGAMTAFFSVIASKCPVVVTFRGSDINGDGYNNWLHDLTSRFLSQVSTLFAKGIICVSEGLRRNLWFGNKCDVVRVISEGINLEAFPLISREKAREHLGWPLNDKVILFNYGGRSRNKRIDLALAAIELTKKIIDNIRFEVLNGEIPPNIVPYYLNGADLLLLTSDKEGSPTIIKEAMACNLPIVSVPVGDVLERLADVIPSRVVERNVQAIGVAMAEIILTNKRSNGREIVKRELMDTKMTKQMIEFYHSILSTNQSKSKKP